MIHLAQIFLAVYFITEIKALNHRRGVYFVCYQILQGVKVLRHAKDCKFANRILCTLFIASGTKSPRQMGTWGLVIHSPEDTASLTPRHVTPVTTNQMASLTEFTGDALGPALIQSN